ncbi:phosphodiester glycosidase family protein [Abyssalbus ytuae]|uniref:Phosphodiester glycosidase family protein n=1 Tax=Abyssalbus ytuae TaxID=2926907 RepID=A0A9E6ZZL1_9FLAO|nr:phosphodiester glycosidase family protein [Abyssalbus ytuae]UOB16761.1 phosphodiester glycosidase family protein [Abyssalbus ytuae]
MYLLRPVFILLSGAFLFNFGISFLRFQDEDILSYTVDLSKQNLKFFWKDGDGDIYKSFDKLKKDIETNGKTLVFAMNGGMYTKHNNPQGLYIENGKILSPLDTIQKGYGNFYLQPNGVFYILKNSQAFVRSTTDFKLSENINYATQSGPMLLIGGKIHPVFKKGSDNLNIRNGVGILPDGRILFAMSEKEINLYDFASYFKRKGCENALYLDGFVSKTYLPEKNWKQLGGHFGVIIAEIK